MNTITDFITMAEAAELLGASYQSVRRWMTLGYRGVILRTVKPRGRRYTTREWIEEFNQETTAFGGSVHWAAEKSLKELQS